jgi:hypothetical protein
LAASVHFLLPGAGQTWIHVQLPSGNGAESGQCKYTKRWRAFCQDTLAEWSKAPDSSSGGAICVGSNPTGVIHSGPYPRKRWNVETCQAGLQTQLRLGPTGAGTPRSLLKVALAYRNRPGCAPSFRGLAWKQWRNEPVNRQHANEGAVGRAGRLANVPAFFPRPACLHTCWPTHIPFGNADASEGAGALARCIRLRPFVFNLVLGAPGVEQHPAQIQALSSRSFPAVGPCVLL